MSRRSKDEAERTRARILASALALFAKNGYERTTFTHIAARLKLTKGAVYWHFASKEALLLALIDGMLAKFKELIACAGDLTFPRVAEILVANAVNILDDRQGTAFFLLMHEQIRWSSSTMDEVRRAILQDTPWGPWSAVRRAVENDIAAGRVRAGVDPVQVATGCIVLWNGLVHGRIAKLLPGGCSMEDTLRTAYAAIWRDIAADGGVRERVSTASL